jgi:hypothetical protein
MIVMRTTVRRPGQSWEARPGVEAQMIPHKNEALEVGEVVKKSLARLQQQ